MANTYVLIATATATTTTTTSLVLGSIPNTYDDLVVRVCMKTDRAGGVNVDLPLMSWNSNTGMFNRRLETNGGTPAIYDGAANTQYIPTATTNGGVANVFGSGEMYVSRYKTTTAVKGMPALGVSPSNTTNSNAGGWTNWYAGVSNSSTVLSSLSIGGISGTYFIQGSTVSLYGITRS
jgi:hypothetical protein